ncbi:hypothetical protein B7755_012985 [Streptomyces sp. NBS 14/10]|uniref:hypothetical protein n=1 Tax=Streptomyces sp. NBS 14/10 TaxID=1945643 RepID=UPI000B7C8E6F|nr:hypothetical protein [Streptomyces sp. NBS 14/10]KAK1178980.1 hypothetical protein B7755_012985 [Streptomyces sp. NBS 14/10]
MSNEPRNTPDSPSAKPATETTAVLNQTEGAYGARFDEDAFNYPSPATSQAWPGDEPLPKPADAAGAADAAGSAAAATPADATAPGDAARHARGRGREREHEQEREREAGRWQRLLARRRPVLAVAAALMVLGGFGFALSAVSDTVSSNPSPVGTVRDPASESPTEQPQPPGATPSPASPPGGGAGVLPTPTGSPPSTADRHDDEDDQGREEDQGRREDQQNEDGDRSGDD